MRLYDGRAAIQDEAGDELGAVVSCAGNGGAAGGGWQSERVAVGSVRNEALYFGSPICRKPERRREYRLLPFRLLPEQRDLRRQ